VLELSIPLNGFPRRGSPALPSCPAVSLSIPLNGFQRDVIFRVVDAKVAILSIPLNGFMVSELRELRRDLTRIFQFH